jgi:endonuclease/exonuclease/phosphatase family metal-dependent hydrolase
MANGEVGISPPQLSIVSPETIEVNMAIKMRIMTLNTAIIPKGLRQFENEDKIARAAAIANKIVELRPDIVCLQELFHDGAARKLLEICKEAGYHTNHKAGLWIGSGLATLSLRPIELEADLETDHHGTILARYLNRPIQKTVIEGGIAVFNLHLSPPEYFPWYSSWHKWCVEREIKRVVKETRLWQLETGKPWIVAGDYNYKSLYFSNVTYFENGTVDKTRMYLPPFLTGPQIECIDHVATSGEILAGGSSAITCSSDHLAVLVTVQV